MLIRKSLPILLAGSVLALIALQQCRFFARVPTAFASPTQTVSPLSVEPPTPPEVAATQPADIPITVYFTDINLYATGTPPFEVGVTRWVPAGSDLPLVVLEEFFKGPTSEEAGMGLEAITSGFTGIRALRVEEGIAHLYLAGTCQSMGATYTIAQPVMRNLLQFETIQYVKIYDGEGSTEQPEGFANSIPFCLEP